MKPWRKNQESDSPPLGIAPQKWDRKMLRELLGSDYRLNPPSANMKPNNELRGLGLNDSGAISGNRDAEMALCFLAMTSDELKPGDLSEADFYWHDTKFIFGEYLRMLAEGYPVTDKAVQVAWFRKPEVIQRMRDADLNWFDVDGTPRPYAEIFQLVIDGGFASMAHLEHYRSELRRWRIVRAIRYISHYLRTLIDSNEGNWPDAIDYVVESGEKLKQLAETISSAGKAT